MTLNPITLIDGYKLDHRRQYPEGTQRVYSNWTPRSSRIPGQDEVVFFGLQYFLQKYLGEEMERGFFRQPKDRVLARYARRTAGYLGPNEVGVEHIGALHDLRYVPLRFAALPEGTLVPLRVPALVVENTIPEFFWMVNYIETLLSCILWLPSTSATIAQRYRKLLLKYANQTGSGAPFVDWQGHDFSFRGLSGVEAACLSGAGHLLSFLGTDTIPAIDFIEEYYWGDEPADYMIGGSVAATEHSVMCAGGHTSEQETFARLLQLYPSGVVSVVSDTWDLWKVLTDILPSLKNQILARAGKLVIRPDSGNPVKIICGDSNAAGPARKGVVELLWDVFGGDHTPEGYRLLDPHIGVIYGDSITYERCQDICEGLVQKGFSPGNMVFGIGSFTYQYNTRDTFGHAMKATWAEIDGKPHDLFKKPVTDDGTKFSATGRLAVRRQKEDGRLYVVERALPEVEGSSENLLQPVWENGSFVSRTSISKIRRELWGNSGPGAK